MLNEFIYVRQRVKRNVVKSTNLWSVLTSLVKSTLIIYKVATWMEHDGFHYIGYHVC